MPRTSPIYYIPPSAISVTPNANGQASDLAVYIARGAKIKVHSQAFRALAPVDGEYREWTLTGRNRRLASAAARYTIYARLRRDDPTDGYLVFAPQTQRDGAWVDKYSSVAQSGYSVLYRDGGTDVQVIDADYWYIRLGDVSLPVSGERAVELDTGILGTEQYNEQWKLNPDTLPLRVDVANSKTAGVPFVGWTESIEVTPKLVAGWDADASARVDHWTVVRDTGDATSDAAWNHPDGDERRTLTGSNITLTHARGANDDFNAAPSVAFLFTAWGVEEPEDSENSELVALATGSITILAETVEKYELALSTHLVSYNPQSVPQYRPTAGIDVRIRATAQDGSVFFLTNAQVTAAQLVVLYAPAGASDDDATELHFSGAATDEAVVNIPISVFAAQQSMDVRLTNAAAVELDARSIAFVRDGEDSKEREWIYRLNSSAGYADTTANRGKQFADDDFVPVDWTDDPVGVSAAGDTEYASWRDWDYDNNQWGAFHAPVVWSHHGEDADVWTIGQDGYWYKNGVKTTTKAEGPAGTGVELKGSVDVLYAADAQSGQTSLQGLTGVNVGECYVVDANRHLYFYTGEGAFPANWNDLGEFKGEAGANSYVHIAYAEHVTISGGTVAAITGFTVNKQLDDYAWIGLCTDHTEQDPGADAQTDAEKLAAAQQYEWNYVKGEPGKDSKEREWIYKLNDNTGYDNTASNRGKQFQDDDFVPTGWSDNPTGVSTQGDIEYASWRDWDKVNEQWGAFHTPVIWSQYGRHGVDGDGVEYVFILTKDNNAPVVPTTGSYSEAVNNYLADEHLPYVRVPSTQELKGSTTTETSGGYNYAKCTDDPQGTNATWQYEWVLKRSKQAAAADGSRAWEPYSGTMSLWSNWAEDGEPGVTYGIKTLTQGVAVETLAIPTDESTLDLYLSLQFWKETEGARQAFACYSQVYARNKNGTQTLLRDATSSMSAAYSFSRTGDYALTTDVEAVVIYAGLAQTGLTTDYLFVKELPVIKHGDTGPQGPTGPQGSAGSLGPMLYPAGKYTSGTIYRQDGNKWPYVVRTDKKTYYLNTAVSSSTWVASQWTEMQQFDAFYANFGILNYGKIASAIFCGDWLYSQYGQLYIYDSTLGSAVRYIVDATAHATDSAHYRYDELYDGEVPYAYFDPYHPTGESDDPGDYPLFAPAWAVDMKTGEMYGAAGNFILRSNGDVEVTGTVKAKIIANSFVRCTGGVYLQTTGALHYQSVLLPSQAADYSNRIHVWLKNYTNAAWGQIQYSSMWAEETLPSRLAIKCNGSSQAFNEIFLPPAIQYLGQEIEIFCIGEKRLYIKGGSSSSANLYTINFDSSYYADMDPNDSRIRLIAVQDNTDGYYGWLILDSTNVTLQT